jgi:DNA mismatch repair protein MSH4
MDMSSQLSQSAVTLTPADVSGHVAVVNGSGAKRLHTGVAHMDLNQSQIRLYEFVDGEMSDKLDELLRMIKPNKCLIPNAPGAETRNYQILFSHESEVIPTDRDKFCDKTGRDFVLKYCSSGQNVLLMDISDREYALAAAGALFWYVCEASAHPLPLHSLTLDVRGAENCLIMDMETVRCLELFHSLTGTSAHSLFSFMNQTRSEPGRIFLRNALFAPSTSKTELVARQDSVQELLAQDTLFNKLAEFFSQLQVNLEDLTLKLKQIPRLQASSLLEHHIECVVFLKHVLGLIPELQSALSGCQSDLMLRFSEILSRPVYQSLLCAVNQYIVEECVMHRGSLNFRMHKVLALREDISQELQIKRKVFAETLNTMTVIAEDMSKRFGSENSVKLAQNVRRGYHLEVSLDLVQNNVPDDFIARENDKKVMRFTTRHIMQLDRVQATDMQDIIILSHAALQPLLTDLREDEVMRDITRLKEVTAYLDFLMSLAHVAKDNNLKRPLFTEMTDMRGSANPLFVHLSKRTAGDDRKPETNDFQLTKLMPMMLITGPNMSGKSGFLRQVALLQVMAQIGSFLPAKDNPQVRIVDRILTRIGCDDDLVTSSSSFMAEASQVDFILRKVTPNSLVVIDELGRGTSDEEGVSLCVAVCEFLLKKRAFTLFATHFHDLIRLQNLYPFIASYYMDYAIRADPAGAEFPDFLYKLKHWPQDDEELRRMPTGIQLAEKLSQMPDVEGAKKLLPQVEVFRKELSIRTTGLKRRMLMAMQLCKLADQPDLEISLQLGEYLTQMRDKLHKD